MTLKDIEANPHEWVGYFGYGSLVNDDTRNPESFGFAGRLKGYRRRWSIWRSSEERRAFGFGGTAALSVEADPDAYCDGLLVFDHKDHLPKVDERESMYDRVPLDLNHFDTPHDIPAGIDCYIYVGHPAHTDAVDPAFPILQSYVDAVMQGFLHKFDRQGVARFVEETEGWQTPIVKDRGRPFYPRSITLSLEEAELLDHYQKLSGAPMVTVDEALASKVAL
ncbi:gamma-glutamylcyclotransferase family protein [uncultured Cohaesibacter sp.]|uniref:gamma-glutamylcyclotransferase family protein n=1 Tax=uncultured Cohaesibacter sp. TaxID=1002546 RepID=UPI0029C655A3|nr:gamma-glutamylcyclotransferase family protein [uncultured Cohaesibacter sp.]